MTTSTPHTPAQWLLFFADVAERHRMVMMTDAGNDLYSAFVTFIRDAGNAGSPCVDLQTDLLTMMPRFLNAIISAAHNGTACLTCASGNGQALYIEIMKDMREQSSHQSRGELH